MVGESWAFIGCGAMAQAIIRGGLHAGVIEPGRVAGFDPAAGAREAAAALGARVLGDAGAAVSWLADEARAGRGAVVVLAVKPQSLAGAAGAMRVPLAREFGIGGVVVVSILAGTPSAKVRAALGDGARVVRAMPNLAARIGQGATAVCAGAGAREEDAEAPMRLFRGVGPVVVRLEEPLFDAFTALAGSGPAYVCYLAEAMERAAARMGLNAGTAGVVVRQVLSGSAGLLHEPGAGAAGLRAAVTSRGGTTEAAVRVLDDAGVMAAIERAIVAARDRGRELGGG